LVSENPFEPLSGGEGLEKQSYIEKIKGKFRKEKAEDDEDDQIKDVEPEASEPGKEETQTLKQKISGGFQNISGKISQNVDALKGKFKSGKEENQEEAPEQPSEEKPLEQPSESSEQESQSLKQKISGGFQNISGKISQNVDALKGKFKSGKEENQEGASEQLSEEKPLEQPSESSEQESQSLKQKISGGFQNISGKISQNVDALKGKFRSGKQDEGEEIEALDEPAERSQEESQPIEANKQSLKEKVTGSFQGISSQISQRVEGLKDRFTSGKEKSEELERDPNDDGKFHKVTEGITETVSELKEEERVAPLLSNNPFEPLETRNTDLTQPLDNAEVVGGDLKELTAGEGPSFKVEESSENLGEDAPNKSVFQKVKASVGGASSAISNQFNAAKDKVLSAFSHGNKDNAAQDEKNENA